MRPPRSDLLVVADSVEGGLGSAAVAHARWFAADGWMVALAAPAVDAAATAPAEAIALDVPGGAFDVAAMVAAARQLHGVLRRRRPRIVHAHGARSQLLCVLAGARPYVTLHGAGRVDGQGALGTAVRRVARTLAPLLAVRAYSVTPAPGRWTTALHASPRLPDLGRLPWPEPGSVPTFLWLGRLDAPKRPEAFVRAVARAAGHRPVRGVMLGDGPLLPSVRALVESLDAPVDVLGAGTDVEARLGDAWAMCLFSDFEGVPFAVQEAMWAGRPVVLSPLPGLRWFAGDAAVYAADVAAAAAAIVDLCDLPSAQAWGERAATRVRELLTEDAPFPRLRADYGARR